MKTNFIKAFFVGALLLCSTVQVYATNTYTLDPQHTYVLWQIKHFNFSTQAGKWYASGTLVLDKDKPENDSVKATIQIADVITGLPELDKHLKGKLFFDVGQFPTATFVSDNVSMTSKTTAKVHGMLTVHGVSKPVVLDVKLNQVAINPITNKMTAGFSANIKIKRSDFGIKTLLPGLSDEVKVTIEAEGYNASQ